MVSVYPRTLGNCHRSQRVYRDFHWIAFARIFWIHILVAASSMSAQIMYTDFQAAPSSSMNSQHTGLDEPRHFTEESSRFEYYLVVLQRSATMGLVGELSLHHIGVIALSWMHMQSAQSVFWERSFSILSNAQKL